MITRVIWLNDRADSFLLGLILLTISRLLRSDLLRSKWKKLNWMFAAAGQGYMKIIELIIYLQRQYWSQIYKLAVLFSHILNTIKKFRNARSRSQTISAIFSILIKMSKSSALVLVVTVLASWSVHSTIAYTWIARLYIVTSEKPVPPPLFGYAVLKWSQWSFCFLVWSSEIRMLRHTRLCVTWFFHTFPNLSTF